MTSAEEIERALDTDPLAVRLSQADVPPLSPELWARVRAGSSPAPRGRRRRRLAIGLGGGAVALAIMATTPVGATIARAILPKGMQQRLGLVVGAPRVLTPPDGPLPGGTPHPSSSLAPCPKLSVGSDPHHLSLDRADTAGVGTVDEAGGVECSPSHLSIASAQRQVTFTIPKPTSLPPGLSFLGADVWSPNSIDLVYSNAGRTMSVSLQVTEGTPIGGSAVPSAQRVTVDGVIGYYVHGSYEDKGPGTPARWNPAADDEELTWTRGGFTYDLTAAGLHFSSGDLIRIAESVR